jgi:hypothetical protein
MELGGNLAYPQFFEGQLCFECDKAASVGGLFRFCTFTDARVHAHFREAFCTKQETAYFNRPKILSLIHWNFARRFYVLKKRMGSSEN